MGKKRPKNEPTECILFFVLSHLLWFKLSFQELGKAEQERNEERNKELLEKLSAATSQKSYVSRWPLNN